MLTFPLSDSAQFIDAPKWYQAGQWARVTNYCADDVALERDLAVFVDKFGFVVNGKTQQVVRL